MPEKINLPEQSTGSKQANYENNDFIQKKHGSPEEIEHLLQHLNQGPENIEDLNYPARLFEACQVPEIASEAREKIFDYIYAPKYREVAVTNLFRAVRYTEVDGLFDAVVLRDILRNTFNYLHDDTLDQSHEAPLYEAARVLDQFFTELRLIDSLGNDVHDNINYLALEYFNGFAKEFGADTEDPMFDDVHVSAHIDEDSYIPFVIQPKQFAVFNKENTELYVLNTQQSEEIAHDMAEPMSRLGYKITETEMGTFSTPLIPQELYAYSDYIRKAGTPVGQLVPSQNTKEIAAYRVIQKTHFKEVLESEFGIFVEDLPIKEQYYFLNYLNRKSLSKIQPVRDFTRLYGTDSMRTFLSLERGDETLGDDIVRFGKHNEIATTVFRYYGELLDSADRAETLVREVSDCEGEVCTELANEVRENILNRAQKDLERAVRANDPREVEEKIQQYIASAKEYVALLQVVGTENIERLTAKELSSEDKTQMTKLLEANYSVLYLDESDEAFKNAVSQTLTKSFDNPNTEFRVCRHEGKIVCFLRFDTEIKNGQETTYFGSFNADPAYSGVGSVMYEKATRERLQDGRPMEAACDQNQDISRKYFDSGFVATHVDLSYGRPLLHIIRSQPPLYETHAQTLSAQQLEQLIHSKNNSGISVREIETKDQFPELSSEKILTRLFVLKNTEKLFGVFEEIRAANDLAA